MRTSRVRKARFTRSVIMKAGCNAVSQSASSRERQACRQIVMRMLEDVTTDMALCIPVGLIGDWIIQEFSSKQFAYFRSSLLSLLSAHSYEFNILQV